MLTRLSVDWAERIVATSSSSGLRKSSSQCALGDTFGQALINWFTRSRAVICALFRSTSILQDNLWRSSAFWTRTSRKPVMLSEVKHLLLLLWRAVGEMIRDSSPAAAGSE